MLVSLRKRTIAEANDFAPSRQVNAYDSFMAGKDTLDLATKYKVSEARMLRWISLERSRRHDIASPYGVQS